MLGIGIYFNSIEHNFGIAYANVKDNWAVVIDEERQCIRLRGKAGPEGYRSDDADTRETPPKRIRLDESCDSNVKPDNHAEVDINIAQ